MSKSDVEKSVEKDWEEATSYDITDDDIERAKLLLDVDRPNRVDDWIHTASEDNIRNFVRGYGSDNPLHCDPRYAKSTRWGGIIAPGMMAGIMNKPMLGGSLDPELKAKTRSLFKGVHVFVSGAKWEWYRPIYPGDTLYSFQADDSQEVKESEFAGRSVIRVRRDVKVNQRAEVVAVYRSLRVHTGRKKAAQKGKYARIEPQTYSDEDIAAIDARYAVEGARGEEKRYIEDVNVGDSMGDMTKGPLTITDVVMCHMGGYGYGPYYPGVGRLAYQNRQRIPAFYIKNQQGVPDVSQRLHWDAEWAKAIGNPMAYDYGVMREQYFAHYLSDWCGDDAIVLRTHDEVRKFNYMGDIQYISGEITEKREEGGQPVIEVNVRFNNQRDEETFRATATIALPSRQRPLPIYPEVPASLKERAVRMMNRHWELLAESGRN